MQKYKVQTSKTFRQATKNLGNGFFRNILSRRMWGNPTSFPLLYRFDVTVEKKKYAGHKYLIITSKGEDLRPCIILFLPGTNGIICPTDYHYSLAVDLAYFTNCTLYFPCYDEVYDTDWVQRFYHMIRRNNRGKSFFVVGDSAGANRAVNLCTRDIVEPQGLIICSPVFQKETGESLFVEKDVWQGIEKIEEGNYEMFPDTMIVYGEKEASAKDIMHLARKLDKAEVDVTVYSGKGHMHDWVLCRYFPEAKQMMINMVKFIIARYSL